MFSGNSWGSRGTAAGVGGRDVWLAPAAEPAATAPSAPAAAAAPKADSEPAAAQRLSGKHWADIWIYILGPAIGGVVGWAAHMVTVRGDTRESVLRFSRDRPPEGAASAKSLLELFGYPVGRWKGPGA